LDKTHTNYWSETKARFKALIKSKIPLHTYVKDVGKRLNIMIKLSNNTLVLNLNTNENYLLEIKENENEILVEIDAPTYFGGRHAMETLAQLIIYDEFKNEMIVNVLLFSLSESPLIVFNFSIRYRTLWKLLMVPFTSIAVYYLIQFDVTIP